MGSPKITLINNPGSWNVNVMVDDVLLNCAWVRCSALSMCDQYTDVEICLRTNSIQGMSLKDYQRMLRRDRHKRAHKRFCNDKHWR